MGKGGNICEGDGEYNFYHALNMLIGLTWSRRKGGEKSGQ